MKCFSRGFQRARTMWQWMLPPGRLPAVTTLSPYRVTLRTVVLGKLISGAPVEKGPARMLSTCISCRLPGPVHREGSRHPQEETPMTCLQNKSPRLSVQCVLSKYMVQAPPLALCEERLVNRAHSLSTEVDVMFPDLKRTSCLGMKRKPP